MRIIYTILLSTFFFIAVSIMCAGLFLPHQLYAETEPGKNTPVETSIQSTIPVDPIITRIEVTGLKRSKDSLIKHLCGIQPGDRLSEFNPVACKNSMMKSGLFSEVTIDTVISENSAVIHIHALEKWTLIPMPFAASNSNSSMAGFFLMDMNMLGLNKKLFVGGIYSTYGWKTNLGIIAPHIGSSNYTGSIFSEISDYRYENADAKGEVYEQYDARLQKAGYSLGYKFFNMLTLSVTGNYNNTDVYNRVDTTKDDIRDARALGQGLSLRIDTMRHTGTFLHGLYLRTDYTHGIPLGSTGAEYDSVESRLVYSFGGFSDHLVKFYGHAGTGDMPDAFEERIGGKPGFRALPPEQIPADTYAGGFIAYEIPWLYLSWGTITAQGYWENGMYSRTESPVTYFYGPGGGFRLYLKKIAIPAVGIDTTYNFEERSLEMSAAVGFRM